MSIFEYITVITIGTVVADISLEINKNIISYIVCLFINILISYLSLKSIKNKKHF